MRILLTKIGNLVVKNLNDEKQVEEIRSNSMINLNQHEDKVSNKKYCIKNKILNLSNKQQSKNKHSRSSSRSRSSKRSKHDKEDHEKSSIANLMNSRLSSGMGGNREISVKVQKINIPFTAMEKYSESSILYDENGEQNQSFLPSLPKNLHKQNEDSFPMNEIFKQNVINTKRQQLRIREKQKEEEFKLIPTTFRSVYRSKSPIEEFEEKINKAKIDVNCVNLINYLNKQTSIQNYLIDRISNNGQEEAHKLNKIIQIIQHRELHDLHFNKRKEKIERQPKTDNKSILSEVGRNVNISKTIIDGYLNQYKSTLKDRNFSRIEKIEKLYWEKYNVANLSNKQSRRARGSVDPKS